MPDRLDTHRPITDRQDPAPAHTDRTTEIVVLGGGYVAVWGYRAMVRRLSSQLDTGKVRITVLSSSSNHGFHGWTGEVLAGLVRYEHTRTPLEDLMPRAHIVRAVATRVDVGHRHVTAEWGGTVRRFRYDHLLVGVGSHDRVGPIPGMAEHGWTVKGDEELLATQRRLIDAMQTGAAESDAAARRRLLTIVIAGGGFAGVEMAAAVTELGKALSRTRPGSASTPAARVVLVHGGDALLPEIRPRYDGIADYAHAQLHRAGVDVRLGRRVASVTATKAVLDDGSTIDAATVVSTVGQAPVALPGLEDALRDPRGRMVTDAWLRTTLPDVWAGGDTAAVPRPGTGQPCPPNALWAIHHGKRAGDNIARTVTGRRPRRFRFPGLGQAASLGVGRGAAELYGLQLRGWLGWLARWGFFHWFMPSHRVAIRTVADWLRLPFTGRQLEAQSPPAPRIQRRPAA